ncbi:MAG TPA: S46 family peptidase [Gemmatimonadaceae bacterium]|nr:S46 family peptidase [Gemmatimonadaceae bacterium]
MWTFDAPPMDYWKARYDFTPSARWLDHVRLSALRIPGCSASFVSPRGLVMSNDHCARSCVAAISPADTDYGTTGYIARTLQDEKKCPGMYADQLQSIQNVTPWVQRAITAAAPAARVAQRDSVIQVIQNECHQTTQLICQVVTFYQGGMYSLYRYKRYSDVRLVFVPEQQIAFFGGDADNFTYPRYDFDISLFRVYDDNAPRPTPNYLRWSTDGAQEGDLVFVVGNPGSTGRLLTLAQLQYLRDVDYPARLAQYDALLDALQELSARDTAAAHRYANTVFGIQNAKKAIGGYLAGLRDSTLMAKKRVFEQDFRARIAADSALQAQYGSAWSEIARAEQERDSSSRKARFYDYSASPLFSMAGRIVQLPAQSSRPDSARLSMYRGQGLERARASLLRDRSIDTVLDKVLLATQLRLAQRALPRDDPFLTAVLGGRSPEAAAKALVSGTRLTDVSVRRALVQGGAAAVDSSTDPMIVAARAVRPLVERAQMHAARLNDIISANAVRVGKAIFAAYGKTLPPDATFTLRISDGVVKGYPTNGTMTPYKTVYYGLYARSAEMSDTGAFALPPRWVARKDSLVMTTPLDFVSTNDIIGGNSGSPVIDRNAEVVGLVFDGNIQMLPNNFVYTDSIARAVSVDSRGIIEGLRGIYGATRIADELQGVKQ